MEEPRFSQQYLDLAWSRVESSISVQEEERIAETLSILPGNCSCALDVGCGDGRITNRLTQLYPKVVGLDISQEALNHVKAETRQGSIDSLPFEDQSFSLVLCCEVLEHLSYDTYTRGLMELQRVASDYIFLTVPNNENLKKSIIHCSKCGYAFHMYRHLRSFSQEKMKALFDQFEVQSSLERVHVKQVPESILTLGRIMGIIRDTPVASPFPCPKCGYHPEANKNKSSNINTGRQLKQREFS